MSDVNIRLALLQLLKSCYGICSKQILYNCKLLDIWKRQNNDFTKILYKRRCAIRIGNNNQNHNNKNNNNNNDNNDNNNHNTNDN